MRNKPNAVLIILLYGVFLFSNGCSTGYRTHGIKTLLNIEKNPSRYIAEMYAFRGEVIQAQESSKEIVFQMLVEGYAGSSYSDSTSLMVTFARADTPIIEGSSVRVLGYIGPPVEGYNAFGGSVSSVTMQAIAVSVDGMIYYFEKDKAVIDRWTNGLLFISN